jgi:hypothetical protein
MKQPWPAGANVNPEVEAELERLPATPIVELRKRYRDLFRAEPPKAFGPDLMRRSIAHRIQEKAYVASPLQPSACWINWSRPQQPGRRTDLGPPLIE